VFQLASLDGEILGDVAARHLERLTPVWRNRWQESRSFTQAILKEFRPAPTALHYIAEALQGKS